MSSIFDHYNIDLVKVSGIVHGISLQIIAGDVGKFRFVMSSLRAAIFKMLCLENLCKVEATNKNDKSIIRLRGKEIGDEDKMESFLNIK